MTAWPDLEYLSAAPLALTLAWQDGRITAMTLAWSKDQPAHEPRTEAGKALAAALQAYVERGECAWPELPLDWHSRSPFQAKVLEILAATKPGQTLTYGELAALAGSPNAARAVGRVMATNPWPLVVPCHRVVGSSGLTGFGPGLEMKRWLLEREGSPAAEMRD